MKKIILFNILITIALFPYIMERWIHLPYDEGAWSLEIMMVFGTFLMGAGLSISNILLLLSLKWTRYKPLLLKGTMIFLAMLFFYPIYAGVLLAMDGEAVWVDIVALAVLYGNLWLSNKEYQQLIQSCT